MEGNLTTRRNTTTKAFRTMGPKAAGTPVNAAKLANGRSPRFDAEFFAMPDGTVTAVIRSPWPTADDVVEVLGHSVRRGPKRVERH
jgi:hypothetical protein